jgi:hypothetical protein
MVVAICLLTDYDKINILYRGHSMDASYQISVHLTKRFQRKRFKCENLTDRHQVMAKGNMAFRPSELKKVICTL